MLWDMIGVLKPPRRRGHDQNAEHSTFPPIRMPVTQYISRDNPTKYQQQIFSPKQRWTLNSNPSAIWSPQPAMTYKKLGKILVQLRKNSIEWAIFEERWYKITANPRNHPIVHIVEKTRIIEDVPGDDQMITEDDTDDHAAGHQDDRTATSRRIPPQRFSSARLQNHRTLCMTSICTSCQPHLTWWVHPMLFHHVQTSLQAKTTNGTIQKLP